jgi:hypothetical protein
LIALDTSAILDFLRKGQRSKSEIEFAEKSGTVVTTTTLSQFELLSSVYHRKLGNEERKIREFIGNTQVLDLDSRGAQKAAMLMGALLRIGKPVNAIDVMISGIAESNDATFLITLDSDFPGVGMVTDVQVKLI